MIGNYLKVILRNLKKHKGYSFINICGLAVGMTASLLIFLYVQKELSYDGFHAKADRIHRALLLDKSLGVSNNLAGITWPTLAPALKQELPEVVEAVRIWRRGRVGVDIAEQRFYTQNMVFADPEVFRIFDFSLEIGDPATALAEPFSAVITRTLAEKLYGQEDPVGKTFISNSVTTTITGILSDIPEHSHLLFDLMVSLKTPDNESGLGRRLQTWNWIAFPTYFLLNDAGAAEGLEAKMIAVIRKNGVSENFSVSHQPLKNVHLHSKNILFDRHNQNKGEIGYVYSLGAIAFIIILIASINFMNLATARSSNRAREVGMRKVVGARRQQLVYQFLGESLFLCLLAFVIALGLVMLLKEYAAAVYNFSLDLSILARPPVLAGMLGAVVLIGLVSGSYPALVLSSFRPVQVLKGAFKNSGRGVFLRRLLVVLQFAISIAMIISSGIVFKQMQFIRSKNIGYDRSQVLNISLSQDMAANFEPFTEKLAQSPDILSWSAADSIPGRGMSRTSIEPEGLGDDSGWVVSIMAMDEHYLKTLGMELAAGRNFSQEFSTDAREAVILNEAAVRALSWEEPVGKTFNKGRLKVIGVVKDFHFTSLRHQIEPLVIRFQPDAGGVLSLKLAAGKIMPAISFIRSTWAEMYPGNPLEFTFLDEEFDRLYHREQSFGSMTRAFTLLAILIACLGLFGLASHMVEQRTKEIGIRKVLGSTVTRIVYQLSRNYLLLILISNIIAWPVTYYLMNRWLQDFAYRTRMELSVFVFSTLAALAIALLTVSYQSIRAALANPADSLRYE